MNLSANYVSNIKDMPVIVAWLAAEFVIFKGDASNSIVEYSASHSSVTGKDGTLACASQSVICFAIYVTVTST